MRLTDPARIREFLFAGNATFTVVSSRTGTRFTYRLRSKKDDPEVLYLHVLCAPDVYKFTGVVAPQPYTEPRLRHFSYNHSFKKGRLAGDAPSVKAFTWFLEHLQDTDVLHKGLEFWHEGKCGKCGRALTVPESIATGLGPECSAVLGVKRTTIDRTAAQNG